MKIKSDKGYVGVDVSIAVIILLILVPTIMGIVFAINRYRISADVKSEALNIAVNAVEAAKGLEIPNATSGNILMLLKYGVTDIHEGENEKGIYFEEINDDDNNLNTLSSASEVIITTDKAMYKLQVSVTDYSNINNTTIQDNIVKTVTAEVTYKIGGSNPKSINLSTVLK